VPQKPPDLISLVRALEAEGASYVVIGGMAMVLHGCSHVTMDSDFAIASAPENAAAVVRALASFEPIPSHLKRGTHFVWDERSIRGAVVSLDTTVGDVDLLLVLPGLSSYEELLARSTIRQVGGFSVRVAAIPDLIAMKKAANREQDRLHILQLESVLKLSPESEEA
jgi:hypothetical protein